jgi:hypothetical protein
MRWYFVVEGSKNVAFREKSDAHARRRMHGIVQRVLAAVVAQGGVAAASEAKLYRAGRTRPTTAEGSVEVATHGDI